MSGCPFVVPLETSYVTGVGSGKCVLVGDSKLSVTPDNLTCLPVATDSPECGTENPDWLCIISGGLVWLSLARENLGR